MNFDIQPITKEELSWFMEQVAQEEGWLYSREDVKFYFNHARNQIHVLRINDELAGCVLVHRSPGCFHGKPILSLGFFIVSKKHRGYAGPHLVKKALNGVDESMIVCFHAVPTAATYYEQRLGFIKTPLTDNFYALNSHACNKSTLKSVSPLTETGRVSILDPRQYQDIDSYNQHLFPGQNGDGIREFIGNWLQRSDIVVFAYYEQNIVKGYAIMAINKRIEKSAGEELCYRLAPLYADSAEIADAIIKRAVDYAFQTKGYRVELNTLANSDSTFAQTLKSIGFETPGFNYVFSNHSGLFRTDAPILKKVFTSIPLEYPHEVTANLA